MLIVRKVIRSPPSWSLRFLSKRLRNRSSSTTRASFLQTIGVNLSDDESNVYYGITNSPCSKRIQEL
jgi:hypothetical protein